MRFNLSTTEPALNTDILIQLNSGIIHEGEFVKVLDKDGYAHSFYHVFKTNEYLPPMLVMKWALMGNVTTKYYDEEEN